MTKYICDTNAISDVVKEVLPDFTIWLSENPHDCWISVASLHEAHYGIHLQLQSNRFEKQQAGHRLEKNSALVLSEFNGRFIPITPLISECSGRLRAIAKHRGRDIGVVDSIISATAIDHNLTVITSNLADFAVTGVPVVSPRNLIPSAGSGQSPPSLSLLFGKKAIR